MCLQSANPSHSMRKCKAVSNDWPRFRQMSSDSRPHKVSCLLKLQCTFSRPITLLKLFLLNCNSQLAFAFGVIAKSTLKGYCPKIIYDDTSDMPFRKSNCWFRQREGNISTKPRKFVFLVIACSAFVARFSRFWLSR